MVEVLKKTVCNQVTRDSVCGRLMPSRMDGEANAWSCIVIEGHNASVQTTNSSDDSVEETVGAAAARRISYAAKVLQYGNVAMTSQAIRPNSSK